jgi:hypothetical protein
MVSTEQNRRYGAFSPGRNPLSRFNLEKIAGSPRGSDHSLFTASSDEAPGDSSTVRTNGDAAVSPEPDGEQHMSNGDGAISLYNEVEQTSVPGQTTTDKARPVETDPASFYHRKRFDPRNGSFR